MRTPLLSLQAERLVISCLLGALVLAACDDPSSTGQSKSPAKGSKADTPEDESEGESEDESEDDTPPKKVDAGKGTKPKPETPAVPASDPNQIRPRDPPAHVPTAADDAGAALTPTVPPNEAGAPIPARDAGPPDAGRADAARR